MLSGGDYKVVYHNADQIMPEWQHPPLGEQIIQDLLKIAEVKPDEYLLADSTDFKEDHHA